MMLFAPVDPAADQWGRAIFDETLIAALGAFKLTLSLRSPECWKCRGEAMSGQLEAYALPQAKLHPGRLTRAAWGSRDAFPPGSYILTPLSMSLIIPPIPPLQRFSQIRWSPFLCHQLRRHPLRYSSSNSRRLLGDNRDSNSMLLRGDLCIGIHLARQTQ